MKSIQKAIHRAIMLGIVNQTLNASLNTLKGPILITGHSGFMGTWLTFILENLNIECVGISLPAPEQSLFNFANRKDKIQEFFYDLNDHKNTNKIIKKIRPSVVIHLAAQPLVLQSYTNIYETFTTNVIATMNVLQSSLECDSIKAVLVSTTDKVYENLEKNKAFTESDPLRGNDPYSCSKVATESVIVGWQKLVSLSSGPMISSIRCGNVIGGGDLATDRLLPDLIRGFMGETTTSIRNATSTRPWQHVLDPLYGFLQVLQKNLEGSHVTSINFGPDSEGLSVKRVTELACEYWPQKTGVSFVPELKKFETNKLNLSSRFAKEFLNWHPVFSQEESIENTINWWKRFHLNHELAELICRDQVKNYLDQKAN